MKSNLFKAAIFTSAALLMIIGLQSFIDLSYKKVSKNKFNLLLTHKIDEDIMVFGSSVAYVHINPETLTRATGLGCYNAGMHGVFSVQYNAFIKEYLSYEKKCKCIVIACDFENLGKNEFITRPDFFLSHLSNKHIYKSLHDIEPQKMWLAKNIPGYKMGLFSKGFYRTLAFPSTTIEKENGYNPSHLTWQISDTANTPSFNARYDKYIYDNFVATVDEIAAKGIEVILISPPMHKEGYNLITNAEDIKDKYELLEKNNPRIHFIDYTDDSLCKDRKYFYNYSHMNIHGATIFSETLAKDIKEILKSSK